MNISNYKSKILSGLQEGSEEDHKLNVIAEDEEQIDQLIRQLSDEKIEDQKKIDTIYLLNAVSVFSPVLNTKMAEYVNGLRGLIKSNNKEVQKGALGCLAAMKDEVAQQKLQEELLSDKNEDDKIVPTHQAIAMLGFDEKALDHSAIRKIIENPPNKESLVEAVRHLPANEDSIELLLNVLEDDNQPIEARSMIPDIINNYDPERFLSLTRKIISVKGPEQAVIPFLAKGVAGIQNKKAKKDVQEAKDFIQSSIEKASSDLKKQVNSVLFPDKKSIK